MRRTQPFRDMASAPLDGRLVEVCDGLRGKVILAHWHDRLQGWVDDSDNRQTRRALQFITGWRPVG